MKSINQTSIYNYMDKATDGRLIQTIMGYSLLKHGTIEVTDQMIEDVMLEITNRTSPFQAKHAIESLFKKGIIQLVYNDQLKLTNSIPFFRKNSNGKSVIVINITNFATMRQDGTINMNPNTLYAMMLSAALSLTLEGNITSFSNTVYIMYSRLFSNVVSSLSYLDNIKKEKIQYLAANFFFYTIYGEERTFTNPYLEKLRYNSRDGMISFNNKFPMYGEKSAYKDLETFINSITATFPEMKKLNLKNFIDRWASSFGSSTLFASEYIPYLFYMIISTACLSPVVNINRISTEVSAELTQLFKRVEQTVNNRYR